MSNQGYMRADEETSVSLSDLILTIHHVFQSVNCRSITKEELVHKIIMNNCDIDENSMTNAIHISSMISLYLSPPFPFFKRILK